MKKHYAHVEKQYIYTVCMHMYAKESNYSIIWTIIVQREDNAIKWIALSTG